MGHLTTWRYPFLSNSQNISSKWLPNLWEYSAYQCLWIKVQAKRVSLHYISNIVSNCIASNVGIALSLSTSMEHRHVL